jgi:hypothetical protein
MQATLLQQNPTATGAGKNGAQRTVADCRLEYEAKVLSWSKSPMVEGCTCLGQAATIRRSVILAKSLY